MANITRPLQFVLHMERLDRDIERVSHLIETRYKRDMAVDNKTLLSHHLKLEARLLKQFKNSLKNQIQSLFPEGSKDIFGNQFYGFERYSFIEVSVSYDYKVFSSIRFLEKNSINTKRFAIFGMPVLQDPTTLNIVSDIRQLSDSVEDFFSKINTLFTCRPGSFQEDINVINDISSITSGAVDSDVISRIGWFEFIHAYFAPKPIIVPKDSITAEELDAIEKKYNDKLFKSDGQVDKEGEEFLGLKSEIARLARFGVEINSASKAIFFADLDKQIETCSALYSNIFDRFTLGCLIQEALECVRPQLTCREMLKDLKVDALTDRIALVFPRQPETIKKLNAVIDSVIAKEGKDAAGLTDKILDSIESVIDLEVICDLRIPFEIPLIELPNFPTIDLMFDLSLDTNILEALCKALFDLIVGMLQDLLNCNKLDKFVAGLLSGEIADDGGAYSDLAKLFANPASLTENSNIADSFKGRWDNFANQVTPALNDLINFQTTGSIGIVEKTEPAGMGSWELASDQDRFTLSSFSDERVTAISTVIDSSLGTKRNEFGTKKHQTIIDAVQPNVEPTTSRTMVIREERITGKELIEEIGRLFDSIISLFTPTETLNLLSGNASLETLSTVLEIARINHQRLYLFVNTHQKIALLFETFGRTAGLDNLRDKILGITASPRSNRRAITIPCPPFDNINDFRKSLLDKTLPPDQVIRIIEELNVAGKQRFNDIQDGLIKIRKGLVPRETLAPLLCGTGKNSNNQRPPVVEDSLNSTIGLMFDPTRMMFDREIQKYTDAVSVTKEKSIEVPRKASIDNNIPIFNPGATDGNVFSDLSSLLGLSSDQEAQDKKSDRINPEFKKMVDSGFVPTKKTGDNKQDFEVDGDVSKDYIDGEEPIFKKETIKRPGAAFKEGIKFSDDDIDLDLNRKFKITLKGSLDSQSPVSSFTPFRVPSPEWIIEYTEKNRTTFNIRAGGQIQSSVYGLIPFSENYKIQKDEIIIDDKLKQDLAEITNSTNLPPRQDVFGTIFENKVLPYLKDKNQFKDSFEEMFEEKFENYVKATIREIGNGFARNRLLKKIPNNSLTGLAPEGMNLGNSRMEDLIALNVINFSPEQTEKQRQCGIDPHLLDLDLIKKIVKDRFDKECEEETVDPNSRIDGLSARRSPINSAGFVGVVMTFIRVYTIEYVLRGLFVLDEFKFSKDFAEDDLLIDYITFRMTSDIQRLGFYEDFEKEALTTYEKLLKDGVIETYSNKINSCADIDGTSQTVKSELKALVKHQLLSSMDRIAAILGIDKKKEVNLKTVFFEGLDTFDTFSDFGTPGGQTDYSSVNERLSQLEIPNSGKFILERYIRIAEPKNLLVSEAVGRGVVKAEQLLNPFVKNVINFKNGEEFISKIINANSLLKMQNKKIYDANDRDNSLFEQPWKIGLRLVYIPQDSGTKVERRGIANSKNKFKISADSNSQMADLDPKIVDSEKAFFIFDKQQAEKGFLADDKEYFRTYNPIPILEKEIEISDFITLGEANKTGIFDKIFEKKYFKPLMRQLQNDIQSDILIDYCLFSKRLLSLFMIHSTMVLNSEQMKFLFEGTKQELKKLFYSLGTLGNYVNKNEFKLKGGNAGEFQRKFNRIGNPGGPSGHDALYFWSTTPIHILKALAIMTDPNIFWADKIVSAAATGYLSPRIVRVGNSIRIEGTNQYVNTTAGIVLDNEFKVLSTGEVVKLKNKKDTIGKPFIEHSPVALIDTVTDGIVTLKQEQYPDGTMGPAIRVGVEHSGVPWDRGSNSPAPGISLDAFNELFDQKPSAPVYPGEKINIPYGLASVALTPMQIFATVLGPLCRTMYNPVLPLGMEFLKWEPLLYDLPHFQIASADTMAEDLKESEIDLNGAKKIGCEENEEE